jgi:2-keto-3-deoxy-L-rhamnonate aldolase RhmA
VCGLDYVCFGAWDYSISLGLIGQPRHHSVLEALREVIRKARENGVAVYITIGPNFEDAKELVDEGVRIMCLGSDLSVLAKTCKDAVDQIARKLKASVGSAPINN